MEPATQAPLVRNPLSSAVRAQECISYIHEDDCNLYPADGYSQQSSRLPASTGHLSRPHQLGLQVDTPDEVFTEPRPQNSVYEGNVAYVRPMTRQVISPLDAPVKFKNDQDEFLIFGTSRRLRSEFYDELSKEEELRLREQKVAEREAELQRQIDDDERRRMEHMEQLARMEETAYIDEDGDEYDEEIIEDTITTRRRPQTQAELRSLDYRTSAPAKIMHSVGVGDTDVNQYFLLDTGSRSVNPADFPPAYWERLSRYFTEEIKRRRPARRDAASQLTPPKHRTVSQAAYVKEPPLLRNFGVCVKPITSTRGFTTDLAHSPDKRNLACMTDDLDEYFARLLRSISSEYPNADRTFIQSLYRYSRTDVSTFIRRLLERLEELREAEARQVPPSKPEMLSVGLDVRPVMLNKRTASEPPRSNLGINTDQPICRSQGMSHTPPPRKTSELGVSTGDIYRCVETASQVRSTEPRVVSPPPTTSRSASIMEAGSRKVTTYRIRRVSGHVDKEGKVTSKTFETSGEGKPPKSVLLESIANLTKDSKKPQGTVQSQLASTSDTQKHYISENVMVEEWYDKENPKPNVSPVPRETSPKATVSPSMLSEHSHPSFTRTVEVTRSPTYTASEAPDSATGLQLHQLRRTPIARTLSPSIGASSGIYRANSPNIPLRNYSYTITPEMRKAVEALSNFYLTSPGGTLTDDLQDYLETVRKSWFEMVSQTHIDIEKIEDLFAYLYNSAPELLYLFVRMPTTRGSTCLHYAVGHGAWRVVSLILNTGYADVNKKNAFGFSPIMIAAISDLASRSIDGSAISVLERLFAAGDVNARASTAPSQTSLMLAARKANTAVVDLLLRHGADVNAQDDIGNTALMCAIDCGNVEMVKLLVARPEINMDLKDQEGSTALSIAEAGGNKEIIGIIREKLAIYKSIMGCRHCVEITISHTTSRTPANNYLSRAHFTLSPGFLKGQEKCQQQQPNPLPKLHQLA